MKIVFLDFDGVMNKFRQYSKDQDSDIDPEAVQLLNELLTDTGANVVISSSWRKYTPMGRIIELLIYNGFKYPERIIGFTPIFGHSRGDEIRLWLKQVTGVESFVILDDTDDMGNLFPKFVRTIAADGLTRKDIEKAREILG